MTLFPSRLRLYDQILDNTFQGNNFQCSPTVPHLSSDDHSSFSRSMLVAAVKANVFNFTCSRNILGDMRSHFAKMILICWLQPPNQVASNPKHCLRRTKARLEMAGGEVAGMWKQNRLLCMVAYFYRQPGFPGSPKMRIFC